VAPAPAQLSTSSQPRVFSPPADERNRYLCQRQSTRTLIFGLWPSFLTIYLKRAQNHRSVAHPRVEVAASCGGCSASSYADLPHELDSGTNNRHPPRRFGPFFIVFITRAQLILNEKVAAAMKIFYYFGSAAQCVDRDPAYGSQKRKNRSIYCNGLLARLERTRLSPIWNRRVWLRTGAIRMTSPNTILRQTRMRSNANGSGGPAALID
jgi:hypothetical protein